MLTGRRPDSTHVGTGLGGWCWCQRSGCSPDALFMTLPTFLRRNGFVTAGNGKLFHPDACRSPFTHASGDDPRAWSYGPYGVEANKTQEAWGTIPGPHDQVFNGTMGLSFMESPLPDEETTDGMLATGTIERLANFSREGIGKAGAGRPFFLSTGFHKPVRCSFISPFALICAVSTGLSVPGIEVATLCTTVLVSSPEPGTALGLPQHLPHIAPKQYFDLYNPQNVSLAPNRLVPTGFKEENFHADGTFELKLYNLNAAPAFAKDGQDFHTPLDAEFSRAQRWGYFACVSFVDAQVCNKASQHIRNFGEIIACS